MSYHYNNKVFIFIPVFNEQENIYPFMQEITTSMPTETTYEAIVANSKDKDKTCKVSQQLQSRNERLYIIKHMKNSGKTASIFSRIKKATYSSIIIMNSDRKNDLRGIGNLVTRLKKRRKGLKRRFNNKAPCASPK